MKRGRVVCLMRVGRKLQCLRMGSRLMRLVCCGRKATLVDLRGVTQGMGLVVAAR